jgi:hypothetical protein
LIALTSSGETSVTLMSELYGAAFATLLTK